ncbi:hypothetical protein W97_01291 [Coniosporium apollinis CBS 100218]|uniref:C2H2-type domain-containing protein n=1 Tax=Coniosporium apollinis (strain CBS 100218) TaxID=1168221 RepID=R7YJH5_CONA1|nr:uncharacterized protein W97_01291 [Coniosporium apollinis CBS 100218]EON62072.1 hypothetical protein W97_01291 [Coniosporium apollinis CBS 100218]
MANNDYQYMFNSSYYPRATQSQSSASSRQQWRAPRTTEVPRPSSLMQMGPPIYPDQNQLQSAGPVQGYTHTPTYIQNPLDRLDSSLGGELDSFQPSSDLPSVNGTHDLILAFYQGSERSEAPWNPLMGSAGFRSEQPSSGSVSAAYPSAPSLNLGRWRERGPASEIESTASGLCREDSGYGSYRTLTASVRSQGVPEPLHTERDCPVTTTSLADLSLSNTNAQFPDSTHLQPNKQAKPSSVRGVSPRRQASQQCPYCLERPKCKSEYKKHVLKHEKPYKCDFPGCTRIDGFTTVNDLERHKKSVHRTGGRTKSYKCAADKCKGKTKIWPRLDNFKQHIERMHKEEEPDVDDLIGRSEYHGDKAFDSPPPLRPPSLPPFEDALANIGAGSDIQTLSYNTTSDLCISPDQGDGQTQVTGRQPRDHSGGQLGANLLQLYDCGRATDRESNLGQRQPGLLSSVGPGPAGPRNVRSDTADIIGSLDLLADAAVGLDSCDSGPYHEALEDTVHSYPRVELSDHEAASSSPQVMSSPPADATITTPTNPAEGEAIMKVLREVLNGMASFKKSGLTLNSASRTGSRIAPPSKPLASTEPQRDVSVEIIESDRTGDAARTVVNAPTLNEAMKTLLAEFLKGREEEGSLSSKDVPKDATVERNIQCSHPGCKTVLPRKCDLKKHMKRHTKPYGCTFHKCKKSFGSKNDWKRHESTQHFQHEAWRCLEPKVGSQKDQCADHFYEQASFESHLQQNHQFRDKDKLKEFLSKCRMGRNGLHQYWCGFHRELHPVKNVGIKAWDERFNHIDAMFKEGWEIGKWLCVETDMTKEQEGAADRSGSPDRDSSPSPPYGTANRRTPSPGAGRAPQGSDLMTAAEPAIRQPKGNIHNQESRCSIA